MFAAKHAKFKDTQKEQKKPFVNTLVLIALVKMPVFSAFFIFEVFGISNCLRDVFDGQPKFQNSKIPKPQKPKKPQQQEKKKKSKTSNIVIQHKTREQAENQKQKNILKQKQTKQKTKNKNHKLQ